MQWHAPADCPSADEVAQRFEQLRGDARLTSSFEFVVVERSRRGTYELRIAGAAERYEADDCEALAKTALLLVSLALAPSETSSETNSSSVRTPSDAERAREAEDVAPFLRAAGVRRIDPPPSIALDTPARLTVEVGLTGSITPRPAFDLFLGAGPRGTWWAFDVGLIGRPSFAAPSPEPEVGARMSSWGGMLRACFGGRARRFGLAGCGSLEISAVSARATGAVSDARARTQAWTVVELGPELTLPLAARVAVVLRVSGDWLAVRPNFNIAGAGAVKSFHLRIFPAGGVPGAAQSAGAVEERTRRSPDGARTASGSESWGRFLGGAGCGRAVRAVSGERTTWVVKRDAGVRGLREQQGWSGVRPGTGGPGREDGAVAALWLRAERGRCRRRYRQPRGRACGRRTCGRR